MAPSTAMVWNAVRAAPVMTGPPDIPSEVRTRQLFAVISTTIVLAFAILSYILRLWARRRSFQKLQADDWLMGAGLLITLEPAICEYLLLNNGLGHHIWNVPAHQRNNFLKITFALQRVNQPALVCIKLSILLFYVRLFPYAKFRYFAYANMAYTIAWGIATWVVNLTVCSPIAFYYDKTIPGGVCKNQSISGSVNGALSLLGDICILSLPLPMIWKLHMNTRRKIALCGIFLLGSFVCVTSAIRIYYVANFIPTDGTFTQVYASSWTFMEMGVAVISGNLPLMKPLFERFLRSNSGSKATYPTHSHSQDISRITARRANVDADGFERISDDGLDGSTTPSGNHSTRDIEMDDRAILVKKEISVVTEGKINQEDRDYKRQ